MKITKTKYKEIFCAENQKRKLATVNSIPGFAPFNEKLITKGKIEYRTWDPYKSKWAAALMKKIKEFPIKKNSKVLYLGAASGQSASYIADVAENGKIFCVEISSRVLRDLIFVSEKKKNMIPILGDAKNPEEYNFIGEIDVILQDVAVKNQVDVLIKNKKFLKKNGYVMIAIKSRSVDVSANPEKIFKDSEEKLKNYFEIIDKKRLEPFEKDHIVFLLRKI